LEETAGGRSCRFRFSPNEVIDGSARRWRQVRIKFPRPLKFRFCVLLLTFLNQRQA
jgi:hypothetical protein